MRGVKSRGGTLRDILQSEGVDSFINDSEGYFDTIEINVFMSLLSVIDNYAAGCCFDKYPPQ